ncbi:MAG: hypothetical protein GY858_09940 [Candidatus Omnitrophica bacterium]|nr:hypothetical protein [Candidatus Omnitrophota bacterium]
MNDLKQVGIPLDLDIPFEELKPKTLEFFGSNERVLEFLTYVCRTSTTGLAGTKMGINFFLLPSVIKRDKCLKKYVGMAKEVATEVAEGLLFERGVYGYNEDVYDESEKKIKVIHKYSDSALRDYLRANNPKYRTKSNGQVAGSAKKKNASVRLELLNFKEEKAGDENST